MQPLPLAHLCIIRLSAIGDVAHVISVVQRIQKQSPQTKITWIIGKIEYQLVKTLKDIQFVIFDKQHNLRSYFHLYRSLKHIYFDATLMLQPALRASIISLLIKSRIKIGFDKQRTKDKQTCFSNKRINGEERVHVVDTLHQFVDALELKPISATWQLPIEKEALAFAKQFINNDTVIINPNSSVARRNWTQQGYVGIINYLTQTLKKRVIITGSPSAIEQQFNHSILQQCTPSKELIDLTAKTNLQQLAAIISQSALVIAPDTGPAHIATAVSTPVLSLFADTNPDRARPYLCQNLCVNKYPEAVEKYHNSSVDAQKWGFRVRQDNVMSLIDTQDVIVKIDDFFAENTQAHVQ